MSRWAHTDWQSACAALLPCFNEAEALPGLVAGLKARVPSIYVVDDGSTDSTATVAAAAGAQVLKHDRNFGKGRALRTGFAALQARGFAWVLVMDGDGQHAPSDVSGFFACAERTGAPLVIGNRMGNARRMPIVRRIVNWWMTARLSKLTGCPLADSQCGFRLIHLESLSNLPLQADHFETESELLVQWALAGLPVEFVPIQVIYHQGGSKIHPLVDTWRWLRWWLAQRRSAFRACFSFRANKRMRAP